MGKIIFKGDLKKEMNRFAGNLAIWSNKLRSSEAAVQNRSAEIIAAIYRKKLRRGIGTELSPVTKIITGDHPPLSGLADHVIVKRATGQGGPAVVTFEKGWAKIALLLDRGYGVEATPAMIARLRLTIMDATGRAPEAIFEEGFGSAGFWIIPSRPHIHLLNGPDMHAMLDKVARFMMKTGRLPNLSSDRPESVPFILGGDITDSIDDLRFL